MKTGVCTAVILADGYGPNRSMRPSRVDPFLRLVYLGKRSILEVFVHLALEFGASRVNG
jgi:hypothetical protein